MPYSWKELAAIGSTINLSKFGTAVEERDEHGCSGRKWFRNKGGAGLPTNDTKQGAEVDGLKTEKDALLSFLYQALSKACFKACHSSRVCRMVRWSFSRSCSLAQQFEYSEFRTVGAIYAIH
uniref:Uncharacterized protein n=1 Tax=Setaria italica TaxID=4555 RepID=K3YAW4_SETIT